MSNNNRYPTRSDSSFGNIIGLGIIVLILVGMFFVAKAILGLLYMLGPIILIATLIVDYKVVLTYLKQLGLLFTRNPLYGIGASLLSFLLYPLVFSVLLFRAYTGKKMTQFSKNYSSEDAEFIEYEDAEEDLDLRDPEKIKEKRYDDYFKD